MMPLLRSFLIPAALLTALPAQDRLKPEFDAASIRVNPPQTGFRFGAETNNITVTPGMFRCTNCTLTALIRKAFDLQNYQFPGRASLGTASFEVVAKIPAGATPDDTRAMLQNLLKDRFGLTYHFTEKTVRGYHLVVAKNGPKLKESTDSAAPPEAPNRQQHGQGQSHAHAGLVSFNGSSTFRADHQSIADLLQVLADQLSQPVDDQTRLPGKYDIVLNWSSSVSSTTHADGGAGHGDHGGGFGPSNTPRQSDPAGAPTLFEALQTQLGLKLIPSEQSTARIFNVDHVEPLPTAN